MARSRLHHPICGNTAAPSDKPGKRLASRRYRKAVRRSLALGHFEEMPHRFEFGSSWDFPKDGKHRFDSRKLPHLLRK